MAIKQDPNGPNKKVSGRAGSGPARNNPSRSSFKRSMSMSKQNLPTAKSSRRAAGGNFGRGR